jgi:hypothetical protein
MAKLGECELIYANFSNEVAIKPYAVFVDYEKQVPAHPSPPSSTLALTFACLTHRL